MFKKTTKKERELVERHIKNPLALTPRDVMQRLGRKYDYNAFCRLFVRAVRERAPF